MSGIRMKSSGTTSVASPARKALVRQEMRGQAGNTDGNCGQNVAQIVEISRSGMTDD